MQKVNVCYSYIFQFILPLTKIIEYISILKKKIYFTKVKQKLQINNSGIISIINNLKISKISNK